MIALSRFGRVLRLLTAIYIQVVVLILNISFVLIPSLAGRALVTAVKSKNMFRWRALAWSMAIALVAAYVIYLSAAWIGGDRLDTFSLKSGTDLTTENCTCQPAKAAATIGMSATSTVMAFQARRHT
jgi:hypothetical protein